MCRGSESGKKPGSLMGAFLAAAALSLCSPAATVSAQQPATVRLWNWNVHDKKYQQKMYKLFNERNPDIKIEYTSVASTAYDPTLEAAFIAKDPPDLFLPSAKLTFSYLRTKDLIRPLNDIAPSASELADWMNQYPAQMRRSIFMEGATMFDGKVYIVVVGGGSGALDAGFPLFYNNTLFKEAGITRPPATQSELRQTAAKVTQAGQGKYFGAIVGLKYDKWWFNLGGSLAYAAGVGGGPFWGFLDLKDGRYHYSGNEFKSALNVWIGMNADGSVYPGVTLLEDEQAKMAFATNKAALIFGGDWNVANHYAYNPDADFDVVLPPTPDDGIRRGFGWITTDVGGAFGYMVSNYTKNPAAVWKVIRFICSMEYQEGYVKGGYGFSFLPEANKPENFVGQPQMAKFVQWRLDPALQRVMPTVSLEARRAMELMPSVYPPYEDRVTNIFLGKAGFDTLTDLDAKMDAALDAGIAKAQGEGLKVSRADLTFPDWDRLKDYVPKKK